MKCLQKQSKILKKTSLAEEMFSAWVVTIFSELVKSVENMGPASGYHGWKMGRNVTKAYQWWFYATWLSILFIQS